jgi:hypothetical protein
MPRAQARGSTVSQARQGVLELVDHLRFLHGLFPSP